MADRSKATESEAKAPSETTGHALADHQFGEALNHEHDGLSDHDHDDFEGDGPLEENPLWIQDHVTLTSVGIDIGSSGTQVIFSRLALRRFGEDLCSRYFVVSRDTLYQSPVSLTPYLSEARIDDRALGVDAGFHDCGRDLHLRIAGLQRQRRADHAHVHRRSLAANR